MAKNGGKVNATEQRRGDKGLANGSRKTGASRKSAKLDDDFEVGGVRRGAHPGSVRLGGGVSGDGGKVDRVSVGEEDVNDTAGRQREEDLDRAQVSFQRYRAAACRLVFTVLVLVSRPTTREGRNTEGKPFQRTMSFIAKAPASYLSRHRASYTWYVAPHRHFGSPARGLSRC